MKPKLYSTHISTQYSCNQILNSIVQNASQAIQDRRMINKNFHHFETHHTFGLSNQLALHFGAAQQKNKGKPQPQVAPKNLSKDVHCHRSMHISPNKPDPNKTIKVKEEEPIVSMTKSFIGNRRTFIQSNKKMPVKTKQSVEFKFEEVPFFKDQVNGIKLSQMLKNEEEECKEVRLKFNKRQNQIKKETKIEKQKEISNLKRLRHLNEKIQEHLKKKANKVAYDISGSLLLVKPESIQQSLKRKYPPSKVYFHLDEQQDVLDRKKVMSMKQKVGRGETFGSVVLKTMNMSKFSLNLTSKTCNLDQFGFMRRNDLFNNNHTRQTTTIPFLKIQDGTQYREANINQQISKKPTERTCHSQNRCRFKTYTAADKIRAQSSNIKTKTQIPQQANQVIQCERRRVKSSRPYSRPQTSKQNSVRNSDRISVNEQLISQLIQ